MLNLLVPQSKAEADGLIADHAGELKILGGGTNLLRYVNETGAKHVMAVSALELDGVAQSGGGWSLGAAVTMTQIRRDVSIGALQDAAAGVGGPAIQNMATIGGNLYARQPYGDVAVVLLALDATITRGGNKQSLAEFYAEWGGGDAPSGLVTSIDFANPSGSVAYVKRGWRELNSATVVCVAVNVKLSGGKVTDARVALGGVAAHPIRSAPAEAALTGNALNETTIAAAAEAAQNAVSPKTDSVASDWYRKRMTGVFVRRALEQVA